MAGCGHRLQPCIDLASAGIGRRKRQCGQIVVGIARILRVQRRKQRAGAIGITHQGAVVTQRITQQYRILRGCGQYQFAQRVDGGIAGIAARKQRGQHGQRFAAIFGFGCGVLQQLRVLRIGGLCGPRRWGQQRADGDQEKRVCPIQ